MQDNDNDRKPLDREPTPGERVAQSLAEAITQFGRETIARGILSNVAAHSREWAHAENGDPHVHRRAQSTLSRALTNPDAVRIFHDIQLMNAGDPRYGNGLDVECSMVVAADVLVAALYWAEKHGELAHDYAPWIECSEAANWVHSATQLWAQCYRVARGL